MMMISPVLSNNRGIAIVAVAMALVVVILLGSAITTQTVQDVQLANRSQSDKQALFLAESAKERGYWEIMNNDSFTDIGVTGALQGVDMENGTYDLTATTLSLGPKVVQITGTGHSNWDDTQVTVVAEVIRENVNVWNNAIFGGSGQNGGLINGNAAIHGSVHLLGNNIGNGNNAIEALDLSGSSLIHNNYTGMPADLLARVPGLPTTVFGGETISTISAKLRVKNGSVGVSGSSEIGEANIVGNGIKETMDGIYIETDAAETRWTGNQVTDGVPNPSSVQSDNGTSALYDLGDLVHMPMLDEAYTDPVSGISYATYEDYFSANSLHIPFEVTLDNSADLATALAAYAGDPSLPFGVTISVNGSEVKITDGTNTLAYDPNGGSGNDGLLTIDGMIQIDSDLVVGEKNFDIEYDGRGTIYTAGDGSGHDGDVDVHCDILPDTTFPTVDVLGFMAKNDINLATGNGDSQLTMAGAFYAQN